MSRTYAHRPYWVRIADPNEQNFCFFDQGGAFGWRKMFLYRDCGCRLCTGHYWNKAENRARRHDDQRRARRALEGFWEAWDQR